MTPKRPALLPVELWEQLSEPLQVVISAMVDYYEQRIAKSAYPPQSGWLAGLGRLKDG